MFEKISNKKFVDYAFVLIVIIIGYYLGFNVLEILIFSVFICIILNPVSMKFLSIPSLGFLICSPILYIFGQEEIAKKFAVYAYYFIVMAVLMAIYEAWKKDKEKKKISN